jgi:hypothetical protein
MLARSDTTGPRRLTAIGDQATPRVDLVVDLDVGVDFEGDDDLNLVAATPKCRAPGSFRDGRQR